MFNDVTKNLNYGFLKNVPKFKTLLNMCIGIETKYRFLTNI
jgi:hypothetical protein